MKIYQSILDKSLSINIEVGSVTHRINFNGGDEQSNGIFATNERDVQAALESDRLYNNLYRLKEDFTKKRSPMAGPGVLIEGTVTKEALSGKGVLDTIRKEEPVKESNESAIVFSNIADAQEYFFSKHNVPKYKIRTSKQAYDIAAEHNVKIEFNR